MVLTSREILRSLDPKVARDLLRRGFRVQAKAKRLLGGAAGHPKRVDTGNLRSSIQVQPRVFRGEPAVRIGTGVKYAKFVHDGTGLYGPRRRLIRPKKPGGVLAFRPKGSRRKIFVRYVRGMRKNEFLKDALDAAK